MSQTNFSQAILPKSRYMLNECISTNNGLNVALTTSESSSTLNIDAGTMNGYQSFLQIPVNIACPANTYLWTREDAWGAFISKVKWYQGVETSGPVNMEEVANYESIVLKKETNINDLQTLEPTAGFYPSNSLKNTVPALQVTQVNGAAVSAYPNPSEKNYIEPAYYQVGALATAYAKTFYLPMRLLKNTLFSCDKDLPLAKSLLKLYFYPIYKFAFASTSNISPSAGTRTTLAANAGTYIDGNLKFLQAIQHDKERLSAAEQIKGHSFSIPFPLLSKQPVTGVLQKNVVPLNNQCGPVISKLYYSLFNNTEQDLTAFDNCNMTDDANISTGKVTSFNTFLDTLQLQQTLVNCTGAGVNPYSDYILMKPQMKDSVIQSRKQYQQNWFWCEDFASQGYKYEQEDGSAILSGLPVSNNIINYKFNATVPQLYAANQPLQHYCWMIYQRPFGISADGMFML
jgi:hypothetical protein